jgi:xylulokinase
MVLKWFKDLLAGTGSDRDGGGVSYEQLSSEAELVPPGCDGLVMLPHLAGALFPEYNQIARGVFYGITLTHTRGHFARSIMEAIAFLIRRDLEGLSLMGAGAKEIRILGGGARSRVWSQIKANACQIPVIIPAQEESAALGAAILAAVGCGFYPDIPSAVQAMTAIRETIAPDPSQQAVYDSTYALYQKLYESVKDLYAECDHIKQLARQ